MNRRNFLTLGGPGIRGGRATQLTGDGASQNPPAFLRRSSTGLEPWTPSGDDSWNYAKAAHLLRRCMSGPTETEIRKAVADGLDAVRSVGVRERRILLIGGAAQNPAVAQVAAQVFDAPVEVPAPGEYVADGAAAQAAWTLTGARPAWSVETVQAFAPDPRPLIRTQYAAAQAQSS